MSGSVSSVRIVNVDFYMSPPVQDLDVMYSEFRANSINQVPVIRIFGATNAGKKICLHVHGVFPYLYIPYDGVDDPHTLRYQIAANIDKALNISFGQASSTTQHVYKVALISGIPFYGYHATQHQFFKIFLYNPNLVRKVSNLLQGETLLGKIYQPHESHIPFILQFMIDYNLHGMNVVKFNGLKYRRCKNTQHMPAEILLPPDVLKASCCELEGDILSELIQNREHIEIEAKNPGIEALWLDEKIRKRAKGLDSQIDSCLTLDNTEVEPTDSHKIFRKALEGILASGTEEDELDSSDQNSSLQNSSVYAVETPEHSNYQNASFIDFHSPSLDSLNQSLDLSATLNEPAQELYTVLQDLAANTEAGIEEDSILSQVPKAVPEEEELDENYFDLSLPLSPQNLFSSEDENDKTIVQLDGACDSDSDTEREKISVRKAKSVKRYNSLPICVSSTKKPKSQSSWVDESINVKRKLAFSHDVTIEEVIECRFKRKKAKVSKEEVLEESTSLDTFQISPNAVNQSVLEESNLERPSKDDYPVLQHREDPKEPKFETTNNFDTRQSGTNLERPSKTEELREPSESNNSFDSFHFAPNVERVKEDVHQHKTPIKSNLVEMYDLNNGIQAKPSTSKKLTQDSVELKLSSSSSSDTYYKRNLFMQYSQETETSGELITPYQSQPGPLLKPLRNPPTRLDVLQSLKHLNIPEVRYQQPYYDLDEDVTGSVQIGHSVLKVPSRTTTHVDAFQTCYDAISSCRKTYFEDNVKFTLEAVNKMKLNFCPVGSKVVTPLAKPPSRLEVLNWVRKKSVKQPSSNVVATKTKIYIPNSPKDSDSDFEVSLTMSLSDDEPDKTNSGQITGVTLDNTYGFQMTPDNFQDAKTQNEYQHLAILSMELHIETRQDLKPDPAQDAIRAIFYSIQEDKPNPNNCFRFVCDANNLYGSGLCSDEFHCVDSEETLLKEFSDCFIALDPDILIGYEIEMLSWGYLIERAKVYGLNFASKLARVSARNVRNVDEEQGLKLTGRIVLDGWRLLRHEIALQSYTFESIYYHILHRRTAQFSCKQLSAWWNSSPLHKHLVVDYYRTRVEGVLAILDQLDLIGRTSELARIFGIQFYEVLSRGSQFRVESMMLRLAKPMNYIPVSPSVQQRAKMNAPEFLPLILEPESKFYTDPVIVLDFQSLYPSVMIAYNYCFSTCLGKVNRLGKSGVFEFGATQLKVSKKRLRQLLKQDALNFSPCGVAFVKSRIRDGILPRMLREILEARLMVKKSMKENRDDKVLKKVLHSRQLGLKLIANVTYGYTSANFSGRMPAVELGDSVVSKGRETLQRAIKLVENTREWHGRVVYGDTDSLFVLLEGQSKQKAFEIGQQIADAVTKDNLDPVKLKLEKVYLPCILQTKKRYVGYMYESVDQVEPIYNAKGIETVRRDGCPVVAKMLEKCLRILFETRNVSQVKEYVLRQFNKLVLGRVNLQDLTFAKEYRGAAGYRPGACVPALELARKWTRVDKRNEPRSSERVPYIIANGPPGLPLIKLVKSPNQFLNDTSLRPNITYYITKAIIPPLNRCFNLIGVDVHTWYNQMPRKVHQQYFNSNSPGKKTTISQYFAMGNCPVCNVQTAKGLCEKCREDKQKIHAVLLEKIRAWEQAHREVLLICESCSGLKAVGHCISLDCPVLFRASQTHRDLQQRDYLKALLY